MLCLSKTQTNALRYFATKTQFCCACTYCMWEILTVVLILKRFQYLNLKLVFYCHCGLYCVPLPHCQRCSVVFHWTKKAHGWYLNKYQSGSWTVKPLSSFVPWMSNFLLILFYSQVCMWTEPLKWCSLHRWGVEYPDRCQDRDLWDQLVSSVVLALLWCLCIRVHIHSSLPPSTGGMQPQIGIPPGGPVPMDRGQGIILGSSLCMLEIEIQEIVLFLYNLGYS